MGHDNDRIYGNFAITGPSGETEVADHILGGQILHDAQGRPNFVLIQWQSGGGKIGELQVDYLNALFLLSMLKSIQLDQGTPFPDDPRGY